MRTRIDGSCLVRFGSDSIVTGSENWTAIAGWISREWIEGFRGQGERGTVDRGGQMNRLASLAAVLHMPAMDLWDVATEQDEGQIWEEARNITSRKRPARTPRLFLGCYRNQRSDRVGANHIESRFDTERDYETGIRLYDLLVLILFRLPLQSGCRWHMTRRSLPRSW